MVVLGTRKDMICIAHAHYPDHDLLAALVHLLLIPHRYHHQGGVTCLQKVHDVVGVEVLVIAAMGTAVIMTEAGAEVEAEAEVAISGMEESRSFCGRAVISFHVIHLPLQIEEKEA